jgi:hypothetical protein
MKLKLTWHLKAAIVIVVVAFFLNYQYYRPTTIENFSSFTDFFRRFQRASGQAQATTSYEQFIGWLYAHPETSGRALNDLKARAFQPTCEFRYKWSEDLPVGLGRPVAPANKDLANVAYKSWLDCLARGNQACNNQLNDAMRRFMEPSCNFQAGKDPKTYNTNYSPVF